MHNSANPIFELIRHENVIKLLLVEVDQINHREVMVAPRSCRGDKG